MAYFYYPYSFKYKRWSVIITILVTFFFWKSINEFYWELINPLFIVDSIKYLIWFYIGYYFEHYRAHIDNWISGHKWIVIPSIAFFVIPLLSDNLKEWNPAIYNKLIATTIEYWLPELKAVSGLCLIYVVCLIVSISRIGQFIYKNPFYHTCRKYNYELYLYSYTLNYIIFFVVICLSGEFYKSNLGFALLVLIRLIFSLGGALIIIWMISFTRRMVSFAQKMVEMNNATK